MERLLKLGQVDCARVNVLRVDWKLSDRVPLDFAHFPGLFDLLHRRVPVALGFLFCLFRSCGGSVLHSFARACVGGGDEFNYLSGARSHASVYREMLAIRKNEFGEFDIDLVRWGEFGVQGAESTFAVGGRFDIGDLACGGVSPRPDELVERVPGFDDVATDRLTNLANPNFLIERNLNGRALRNDERNSLK